MSKTSNYIFLLAILGFLVVTAVAQAEENPCSGNSTLTVPTYKANSELLKCVSASESGNYKDVDEDATKIDKSRSPLSNAQTSCGEDIAVISLGNDKYACGGKKAASTSNTDETTVKKDEVATSEPAADPFGDDFSTKDAMDKLGDKNSKEMQDSVDKMGKAQRDSAMKKAQEFSAEELAKKKALGKITDACSGGAVNAGGSKKTNGKGTCSLYKPWKRMTIGLIGAGLASLIAVDAANQYAKAKQRIQELEAIRDALADSAGQGIKGCSEKDFEDSKNPTCYCYNSSGSINNNRDPAGICAALFPYYKPAIISGATPSLQGCVNMQGQFDRDCQCRSQTKSNGQNNCQQVNKLNLAGFGDNAQGLLSDTLGRTNGYLAGNIQTASTGNSDNVKSLANLARKVASKTIKKPAAAIGKFVDGQVKAVVNNPSLQQGGGASNLGSQGLASLSSSLPNSLKSEIDKKTGGILSKAEKGYASSGRRSGRRGANNEESFDLSVGQSGDVDISTDEEFMAKKYDYKDSDVFKDSSASIFKLLSARYQRSAYKRLLNEVGPDTQKAQK